MAFFGRPPAWPVWRDAGRARWRLADRTPGAHGFGAPASEGRRRMRRRRWRARSSGSQGRGVARRAGRCGAMDNPAPSATGPQSIDASGKAAHTSAAPAASLALALHGKPQPPRVAPAPVAAAVIRCQAMPGGYGEIWGDMGGRRSEPEIKGLIFGSVADDGQRHIRRSPEHGDDAIGLAVGIEPAAIFDLKIQPQAAAFGHHLAAVGRAGQVHPDAGVVLDPVAVGALRRVYVQAE